MNIARFHIQAGKLKNLPLVWNNQESTRPTKSIVRESFFNTMSTNIVECVFVEAFGGCGSMGIEALSRGASEAIFYEIDKRAYNILLQNLTFAQKRETALKFYAYNTDFFTQSFHRWITLKENVILYLDPPFCIREGMEDIYERLLIMVENLGRCNVHFIVFEHWSGYNMPFIVGEYILLKTRQFGKSSLTYYTLKD
ncbi:16S rRNA (guanine(966)-N(2))-methyltransferase RsmD [Helicobacter sp. MIT 21-1697]|uniref:16S rRNA (guanine(966)-N(2))-methyltransferase RsmD n=1 Tax=Helicobacter sp. MIT 21-1697 TaxID=2993733 RepID=UPI00224B9905|nr:16S rRNA (guanine(966)-N(2))-methyltransferase RsmD [Helicobacter sp. MIT 21-1697]MCX2717639.1 16S rRNA (guanine(966)-N(2))-methyltransferase RsmD [Helicobacter sp. MIT 21-1697]